MESANNGSDDRTYKAYLHGFACARTGTHLDVARPLDLRESLAQAVGTLHATMDMTQLRDKATILKYVDQSLSGPVSQ